MEAVATKKCTGCKETKSHSEFSRNKSARDGFQGHCKACFKDWQNKNIDRRREYYDENREKLLAYHKQYREKNREKRKVQQARWREENREKYNKRNREKRAEKRKAQGKPHEKVVANAKLCPMCKEVKPLEEFYRDKKARDGRRTYCKACTYSQTQRWRKENSEKVRASRKKYREENAEKKRAYDKRYREKNREKVNEQKRLHYRENAERIKAATKRYCKENPEKVREWSERWSKANPEKRRAIASRYRARRNAADGDLTNNDLISMYDDQQGLCAYCETPLFGDYHADHMVPLSRGGSHDWSNIALTCPPCNLRKNAKTAEEFMETLLRIEVAA